MRYVDVNSLEPGQILGRSIFSNNGTVLLAEDVQLTVYMINTLKRVGVTMVYIKDPLYDDVELEQVVSDETKRAVINKMIETFEAIKSGKEFHTKSLSTTIDRLLEELFMNKEILVQLTDIRTHDNQQFIHALNVCVMAVMIGMNLGYQPQHLRNWRWEPCCMMWGKWACPSVNRRIRRAGSIILGAALRSSRTSTNSA